MKGCFFHFTQGVLRKAQATGLTTVYLTCEHVHRLVRRAAVRPLIPSNKVEDVWCQALTEIIEEDLPEGVTVFTDYVTEQSVETEKATWNHYNTEGPRTTNYLEGWHNKL